VEPFERITSIISYGDYYSSEEKLSEAFYDLCSKDSQSISIKKLFLKLEYRDKFTDKVLNSGLLAAIKHNQEKYVPIIESFMEKNNKKLNLDLDCVSFFALVAAKNDKYNEMIDSYLNQLDLSTERNLGKLQKLFNYANDNGFLDFANYLENNFSVIKKSMNEDVGEYISLMSGAHSSAAIIQSDGSLQFSGSMGGEWSEEQTREAHYSANPILFNLENFNSEILDNFLNKNEELHPSIVEHGLVKSIYLRNNEATLYLFSNEKTANFIKNSEKMKNFLKLDDDWADAKKEARIALSMIELNQELKDNNQPNKKPKI
jgi:hypothetical protein